MQKRLQLLIVPVLNPVGTYRQIAGRHWCYGRRREKERVRAAVLPFSIMAMTKIM